MTACPDRAILLQGLFDGELDAANALECEAHLKTCPACHVEFQRMQAVRDAVGQAGVHRAPQALRARIEASLEAATEIPAPPRRRSPPVAWALGAGGAALAASLAVVVVGPQLAGSGMDSQLVASHVRSLLADHLIDVATSDQHVVKPWFNGKVDFAPPVPELADRGFPLAGGRLDYIGGRVTPAIVYHRRLHTVNLFAWPGGGIGGPGVRTVRRDGYSLVEWSQGGLRFAAVSDIDLGDLKQFQAAFSERSPR